jgi:itaconyl-CoA hydratase
VRVPLPVSEGDTIYAQTEILGKRESRSRPHMGLVEMKTSGFNQDGKVVIVFRRNIMVYKRGQGPKIQAVVPKQES